MGRQRDNHLFVENAARILEAAECSVNAGLTPSDITILIGSDGGIQLVAGNDWPLESLQQERGARMVYRVSRQEAKVRVEGRAGARSCVFETGKPACAVRSLLGGGPLYSTVPVAVTTAPLPAGTGRLLPAASD